MTERNRRILALLGHLVVAFALASLVLFLYQCIRNVNKFALIDLTSYMKASDTFFHGGNPYVGETRRFIYPLFLLLVVYPLQFFVSSPFLKGVAAAVWSLALYASFLFALTGCWKYMYGLRSHVESFKQNLLPFCLIVVMLHPSLQDEFLNGQVNLLVLGSTVAFFLFVEKNQLFWGALFLAAAASVKIAPGLCLLYPLLTRRYRTVFYFLPLMALFSIGIPWLINSDSLGYYRYFVTTVMPTITGSDASAGFRSYSILSTVSYVFHIDWNPILKIAVVCLLTAGLCAPIIRVALNRAALERRWVRFLAFAAIISVIPLTFPMSEAHHLLILAVPCAAIVAYWREVMQSGRSLFRDGVAMLFILSIIGLHVGHGLKGTPIRLIGLMGVYVGMIMLLRDKSLLAQASGKASEEQGIPV